MTIHYEVRIEIDAVDDSRPYRENIEYPFGLVGTLSTMDDAIELAEQLIAIKHKRSHA